jgi:oligopeptide/dipeptide ABC transporter ATP-binding protein
MSVLTARDVRLHVRRGRSWVPVVDGVDLGVERREVVGIVGETGAGKTLLTRALVGLLPRAVRAEGRVMLGGREFTAGSPEARETLATSAAVVLQNPVTALDPLARVSRQITEAVVRHGVLPKDAARNRALDLLSRMGFDDPDHVMRLYPHQLSGGMAQRVQIASALMVKPQVLIVDEPTSALDAGVRIEVLRILRDVTAQEGAGMLLVSHDLALVSHFCDRVVVLYAGRVLEAGRTAAVLTEPRHPYTRALVSCSPSPDTPPRRPLPMIGGAPPAPGEWPSGCVFRPRCPHAFDRCAEERPRLLPTGRVVAACHLYDESAAADRGAA